MSFTVIELDHPRNSPKLFPPTGEMLRSRRITSRYGPGTPAYKHDAPEIPGQRVALDFKAKKGQILNPIMSDENASLRRRDCEVMGREDGQTYGYVDPDTHLPLKEVVAYDSLSDTEAAQWQFWMRRFVDSGDAKLITGTLPDMDACRAALNGELACPNISGYPDDVYRTYDEIKERQRKEKLATTLA